MSFHKFFIGMTVTEYVIIDRSAVKDTDEWPSKYSKLFVEVRIPLLYLMELKLLVLKNQIQKFTRWYLRNTH